MGDRVKQYSLNEYEKLEEDHMQTAREPGRPRKHASKGIKKDAKMGPTKSK